MSWKKGQKVWLVRQGYRSGDPALITETEIVGVGPKYFRIACDEREKYHVDSGKIVSNYTPKSTVYTNIQEYHDKVQHDRLSGLIRGYFYGYGSVNLTLDQLQRIETIINEPKQSEPCGS